MTPEDIAFVEAAQPAGDAPARLRLRPIGNQPPWLPRLFLGLIAAAIISAILAVTLDQQRQQAMLDTIAAQTTTARVEAQKVRAAIEAAAQQRTSLDSLRARKWDTPSVLDIWEELSRLLPDNAWLTEIRLSEAAERKDRKIVITGFATAAADLVGLVDRSPLFQEVALAAPIALDPAEQRERFVLQASITGSGAGEASR